MSETVSFENNEPFQLTGLSAKDSSGLTVANEAPTYEKNYIFSDSCNILQFKGKTSNDIAVMFTMAYLYGKKQMVTQINSMLTGYMVKTMPTLEANNQPDSFFVQTFEPYVATFYNKLTATYQWNAIKTNDVVYLTMPIQFTLPYSPSITLSDDLFYLSLKYTITV